MSRALETYKPYRGPGLYARSSNVKLLVESVLHNACMEDHFATVTTTLEFDADLPPEESAEVLYKFKSIDSVIPVSCVAYVTEPDTESVKVLRVITSEKSSGLEEFDEVDARRSFASFIEQEEIDEVQSISIGTVQGGQSVRLIFKSIQKASIEKHETDDDNTTRLRLTLPALHESFPIEALPFVKPIVSVHVTARVCDPSCTMFELYSLSHPDIVDVRQEEENGVWRLSTSTEASPMEDFIVTMKMRDYPIARWYSHEIDSPDDFGFRYAHAVSILPQFRLMEWEAVRTEMILIVDRSGSMSGQRIHHARDALRLFFNSLDEDYLISFNIISFGSKFTSLFPSPQKLTEETYDTAIAHIASMEADYGNTDILSPVESVLNQSIQPGHSRQIFLLTDGEDSNGNTNAVIAAARRHVCSTRIFTFGIGSGINKTLITEVARASRGMPVFIERDDQIQLKVMVPLDKALHPAYTNAKIDFGEEMEEIEPIDPRGVPSLFNYRRSTFYFWSNEIPETVRVVYERADSREDHIIEQAESLSGLLPSITEIVPRLAADRRIRFLQDELEQQEQETEGVEAKKDEIKSLALRFGLLSTQTCFRMAEEEPEAEGEEVSVIPTPRRYRVLTRLPDPTKADWEKRLTAIIRLPSFRGLWSSLAAVSAFLGIEESIITADMNDEYWLTALVVAALRRAYVPLTVQWNLLCKKSAKCLRKAEKEELIEFAEEFLRTRLEVPDWEELFAEEAEGKRRKSEVEEDGEEDGADDYQDWRGQGFIAGMGLFADDFDDDEDDYDL